MERKSDLFQARIGNIKNKAFIEEYIKITQARLCNELGLSFCPKGLALYTLLKETAGNNGVMKGGKLVPEYYHQAWIDERITEFQRAREGYAFQVEYLNKILPDVMEREKDIDDFKEWDAIPNKMKAIDFLYSYFTEKLIPRIEEFNKKYKVEKE